MRKQACTYTMLVVMWKQEQNVASTNWHNSEQVNSSQQCSSRSEAAGDKVIKQMAIND